MGSLLVLQIYERLSEHNKLRMEHENDRHIGDAAALMILTIILGAMILYFIKHRATGNGRKEKARKSVRASSDANSEHEMRTSLTRQDESVGMGSPKPIDESQFVAISAREPSSDEQLTFSAALTTAAQNDPRNSTGSASSSGSNTYVQSCTPNAMTAQLASTSEGAAGRRVGILEALVPARRLMVDEGTDLDDDPGKEETIAKEIQVAVHQSQGQRTGVLLPIKIAWDKVTDLLMKNLQIKEVDYGRPCQDCGVNCAGFKPHQWRKSCSNCKCPRESHDIYNEENVSSKERLGIKTNADKKCDHSSALSPDLSNSAKDRTLSHAHPRAQGYSWVPPGLPADKIDRYFRELPNHKVPKASSPGEKYRDKQLILQLPKQDLALPYCKFLEKEHHKAFEDFVNTRNECALDIGFVCEALDAPVDCRRCGGILPAGQLGVIAPKFGEQVAWHSACFACDTCHELLVDLTYCMKDGRIFCERHYAEQIKPRCAACDELIFSGEYTKAMNKDWHSGHFCCWQCDDSLTGQRYVLRDEHPYCVRCYEQVFANSCDECSKPIGIDSKDLSYKEKHWHEQCFLCAKCRVSLVDKPFGSKAEKVYCAGCYDAAFASRCDGCSEVFRAGTKKMEYKGHQWHEKCFCCVVCKNPIGTRSFIPRDNDIYCTQCYEEKFATRCIKCNQIIQSGGVTYRNEPWHRECFCCSNCNTCLAGQRFTSRDEKPYCADCFGELFAKRCTSCTRPITGIGGTRFISFEDRNWHNECFICAMCRCSLVGKGFITDESDILCPDCAKQKLM